MTDLDQAMQAAERLNRVFGGECPLDIYREAFPNSPGWTGNKWLDGKHVEENLMASDYETIADAVRPKGPRPVPMDCEQFNVGDKFWGIRYGYDIQFGDVAFNSAIGKKSVEWWDIAEYGVRGYPTEADARLALHWQKFDELLAAAAP